MSFPAYPEYKDSGVPWLEQVPASWELVRFKNLLRERDQRSVDGSEELLSVSAYTGVRPKSESTADGEFASRAESLEGYKVCKQTDLVMNIMLAWNRGLGVTQFDGIVSPAYCVFALGEKLDPAFFDYAVRADEYTGYFKAHSSGVIDSRLRLYPDKFGALSFAKPHLEEQHAIATFLDRETAKIDALVAKQERLIALLQEKRQAVISHAVTKGLDPDAPKKDSGIEWLGAIPAHWDVRSIGSISTKITNGYVGPTRDILLDDGVRYLQSLHIKRNKIVFHTPYYVDQGWSEAHAKSILRAGDVLIVQTGDIGQVAVVPEEFAGCNCHALIIVSPLTEVLQGQWLSWVLNGSYGNTALLSIQTGALHPHLNCGNVKDVSVPVPPIAEQDAITAHVDREAVQFDNMVDEAERAIGLLKERRTALISAAVTGKIDVRGLVEQHGMEAA